METRHPSSADLASYRRQEVNHLSRSWSLLSCRCILACDILLLLSCSCLLLYISISVLENKMSTVLRSDRDLLLHSIFPILFFECFAILRRQENTLINYYSLRRLCHCRTSLKRCILSSSLPLSNKSEALYSVIVFAIAKQV